MEDTSFIFSSGPIEVKEEEGNFFVEGYISTSDLDLVNDIVTKECILDMAEQMKNRTIKLDIEHESFRGGNEVELEINKTIVPAAKMVDFSVDNKGLKVRAMLNKHTPRFNEVKGSVQDGFLDAYSIAFIPEKERSVVKEGQNVRMLDKIRLLNVALTGNPCNTHATMTNIFAKSLDFLRTQDHSTDDNQINYRRNKNMTDEDNKETETSEAEAPVEAETTESPEAEAEAKAKKPVAEDEEEDEEAKKKKKVGQKDDEVEAEAEAEAPAAESEEKTEIAKLKAEMLEVKALLKKPMLKSKIEQASEKLGSVEEKTLNPLDIIA